MQADDAAHEREPKPGAVEGSGEAAAGLEERLAEARQIFGCDPVTRVGDLDDEDGAFRTRAGRSRCARRRELDGIFEQRDER